ncbi:hypothetical protein BY458DRAFT_502804 [Sporodiniella umbellata]|nr:hypothetical protein BY458DRAFT_502804 [Sporodiniella umbellata]
MNFKRPKSILRERPVAIRIVESPTPVSSSWLSRIQSKILSPAYEDEPEDQDDCVSLRKHDLKRVTFSVGNLTEEHSFASDDSPRDVEYEKERQLRKKIRQELTQSHLAAYYDHACIERDGEGVIDQFRAILRNYKSLEKINLTGATITLQHAASFSDILMLKFGLKHLNLSDCKLEDETVRILLCSLLVSNTVVDLNLAQNNLKSKGYRYIAIFMKESKRIQSVDLSRNTIDKKGMQYLAQGIQFATSLSALHLNGCTLKPPQVLHILADGIHESNQLASLSLRELNLPPTASIHVADLLCSHITHMDLSNSVQLQWPLVARALTNSFSLLSLTLSGCQVNATSLSIIAQALIDNRSLEVLDLSKNPLLRDSDEGILNLKNAIARNGALQSLNLSETELDSAAAIALAEALTENIYLSRLDLSKNPEIDMAGVLALSLSIKMNNTLEFLDINIPVRYRHVFSSLHNTHWNFFFYC